MRKTPLVWVLLIAIGMSACGIHTPSTTVATTTIATPPVSTTVTTFTSTVEPSPTFTTINSQSQYQLIYKILDTYPDYFWCDPDLYPVARPLNIQAVSQIFETIKQNSLEFSAILEKLNIKAKTDYSTDEILRIYQEHKLLVGAVSLTPGNDGYDFVLRVSRNQGKTLHGTVSLAGRLKISKEEPSFNTCPICLSEGTLISTPQGPVAVENIQMGQTVWTQGKNGKRAAVNVLKISRTEVPLSFQILRVALDDGRSITASPGHPTADMKALAEYRHGDMLDGAAIVNIEQFDYSGQATFDILPAGDTGSYWADGILLMSTLAPE